MHATAAEIPVNRDGHGRFAPGQSGNPAGKKPGTPNRATRLREQLAEADLELAVRGLMNLVRDGNGVAIRFVLERVFPKPRDREIDLGLAALGDRATPADMVARILRKMAAGEINIDEASRMARLIERLGGPVDTKVAPSKGAAAPVATPAARAGSPAFDLQTAGDAAPDTAAPPHPLNRHERRRAAALRRATRAPVPPSLGAAA
jgi:hypothetical protein